MTQIDVLNGNDAAEFNSPGNLEEPYLAIVTWRTTPGVANSTTVSTLPITELGTVAPGSSIVVPPAAGDASFTLLDQLTLAGFNNGTIPQVVGTVTVAMDADNASTSSTPDPNAANKLLALSGFIQAEVAAHFESLTPDTSTTVSLALQLNAALKDFLYTGTTVQDHALATLGTLTDDDLVGVATTARIPTDAQLSGVFGLFGLDISDPDSAGSMIANGGTESFTSTVAINGVWELSVEVTF